MRSVLFALLVAGCDDTVFLPEPYAADWEGMQTLFVDQCAGCHPSRNDAVVLPFDVERDVCEGLGHYVVPGDPEGSLLWRIVGGEPRGGDPPRMPFGRALPPGVVEGMRLWIEDGAPIPDC